MMNKALCLSMTIVLYSSQLKFIGFLLMPSAVIVRVFILVPRGVLSTTSASRRLYSHARYLQLLAVVGAIHALCSASSLGWRYIDDLRAEKII